MYVPHLFVSRGMYVPAYDTTAAFGFGEFGELFLEAGYEIKRLIDLGFDLLA